MSTLPFGEWVYTETWPNFSSMLFKPLPHWVITDSYPAFYDSESMTAIGQTARLYGAIQELSKKYNQMVDSLNKEIVNFEKGMYKDHICFKKTITNMLFAFRRYVENFFIEQGQEIADSLAAYESRFAELEAQIFNEALEPGTIAANIRVRYAEETKALTMDVAIGDTATDNLVTTYYNDTKTLNILFERTIETEGDTE